ncbi:MAG TPA: hypothetical protein DEA08_13985 [Planctomycetes bacterium]|nr:hypothetical protein [Planctomycetota bacterium]
MGEPQDAAGWWAKAQEALEAGEGNEILDCTQKVLEHDANHDEAKKLRVMVLMQVVPLLEEAGKWERMLATGSEMRLLDPSNPVGGMVEAGAQLELDQLEACEETVVELLEQFPEEGHLHYLRATSLLRRERYGDAVPHFERTVELDPTHGEALLNWGMCLDEQGDSEAALAVYDRALELIPDIVFLHGNRGNSLRNLGRHEEALQSYERALELAPGDFHNGRLRAEVLTELGRYDEAIAACLELSGVSEADYRANDSLPSLDEGEMAAMSLCVLLRSGPNSLRQVMGA